MKKALVEPAVKAIDVLITAELESTSPARYENIAKFCKYAHALSQMAATRVEEVGEVVERDIEDGGIQLGGAVMCADYGDNFQVARAQPRIHLAGGDQADLFRELIAAMTSLAAPRAPVPITAPPPNVSDLLYLRERLVKAGRDTAIVDKKIDAALADMNRPAESPTPTPTGLAPAEALAGLTAGIQIGLVAGLNAAEAPEEEEGAA